MKPLILVTNDDGIVAPGIKNLVEVAASFGEVIVVAPDKPQSGQGHAITLHEPIRLTRVDVFEGIEAYECSGTPVDCVKLAKNVLLKNRTINLCVSGINHGSNASINIIYSGTMSAAMEASLEGVNSIGFSLMDYSFQADFTAARKFAATIIHDVLQQGMQGCNLLNVNIPKGSPEDIKGIRVCKQGEGSWVEEFQEGTDPRGQKYYWLTGKFVNMDQSPIADIKALDDNYVSVVPSGHDLTKYPAIDTLKFLER
ncbi:MAG: 5'/3'-nucleotidase SurE [Saprospiraceae bacterium]|jgi:5'-nucleotidase|nr:5'/3'-nucleotidase SurE [Saprospiraceae bacterium]